MSLSKLSEQNQNTNQPDEGTGLTSRRNATVQHRVGCCTVARIFEAKGLSVDFMKGEGWRDTGHGVLIPYKDINGNEACHRFRIAIDGADRFRWRTGDTPCLYGLHKLAGYDRAKPLFLVEGETDTVTMWQCDLQAVGIPGASTWKDAWADDLADFDHIYLVVEPDQGGETLIKALADSKLSGKVRLLRIGDCGQSAADGIKDINDLFRSDPQSFAQTLNSLVASSPPLLVPIGEGDRPEPGDWGACRELARHPDILSEFAKSIEARVVGQTKEAQILYLALTSRLLRTPVCVAVKGPSSAGKSYLVKQVLPYFPESAYLTISGASEKAILFMEDSLEHRFLILAEAAGLQSEFAQYSIRTLISEGELNYRSVTGGPNGLEPVTVHKEGPTGIILTTTQVQVHSENETRLLSVNLIDSPQQTAAVLDAVARRYSDSQGSYLIPPDEAWISLQRWLETVNAPVVIPFAEEVARSIPCNAVRLRRDFEKVLVLIQAHALLHNATRKRDENGSIIATIEDYAQVRSLVEGVVSEGIEASVPSDVRETVIAVQWLCTGNETTTVSEVARELGVDKSTASRRVKKALKLGYIHNDETRRGHVYQLREGDTLPADNAILPTPEELSSRMVASDPAEDAPPPRQGHQVPCGLSTSTDSG